MSKLNLIPDKPLERERLLVSEDVVEEEVGVSREAAANALATLRELVSAPSLSPDDVLGGLRQAALVIQRQASQLSKVESELKELSDNFNLYANRSLEIQNQTLSAQESTRDRVKAGLDRLDKELSY